MGTNLNNASGASNSGMGRDDVGVQPPFPVDSDRLINTDFHNTNNVQVPPDQEHPESSNPQQPAEYLFIFHQLKKMRVLEW